jgi:hypothetical protein
MSRLAQFIIFEWGLLPLMRLSLYFERMYICKDDSIAVIVLYVEVFGCFVVHSNYFACSMLLILSAVLKSLDCLLSPIHYFRLP